MSERENLKTGEGKVQWSLLPWDAAAVVVEVMEHGAEKYGPGNWADQSPRDPKYFDAAMRHLVAWRSGEKIDPESGVNHLGHAVSSLLILLDGELPCPMQDCIGPRDHVGPHMFSREAPEQALGGS